MRRVEIKNWSKNKIKGQMWNILGIVLLANLIGGLAASVTVNNEIVNLTFTIGGGVLALFMDIGLVRYMVNFINDKERNVEILFSKFKDWKQVILTYLLQFIKIFLWTLLFIVPGIIKAYGYSLVSYILADNSQVTAKEALKLSEEMMKGHKGELFVLQLSFLGWHLLSILTLGILQIWIIPYEQTATTKFLYEIKTDYEKNNGQNCQKSVERAEII